MLSKRRELKASAHAMKRAQASSVDALIAVTVFIVVLSIYLTMADYLEAPRQAGFNEAFSRAHRIAFTLTESAGIPSNWTASSFYKIGLSNGERLVLSESKLLQFARINYSTAAEELGVGDYNLRVRITNTTGAVLRLGSALGDRIAYTTAGHDPSEGDASKFGLRDWLEKEGISFTNFNQTGSKTDFFNWLGNRSSYDVLVLEDAHVDDQDLGAAQQTDFRSWVSGGGVLLNKEHGEVIELFNVTASGQSNGVVTAAGAASSFLYGVQQGDSVACSNSASLSQVSGFEITELVADASTPTIAQVATWGYGSGSVYHVCDTEGSVSGSVSLNNLRAMYYLYDAFGRFAELGSAPANSTLVVPVKRIATMGNATAVVEVTLWKQ